MDDQIRGRTSRIGGAGARRRAESMDLGSVWRAACPTVLWDALVAITSGGIVSSGR